MDRREFLSTFAAALQNSPAGVTRYVRFRQGSQVSHGILEGESIRRITGPLLGSHRPTGAPLPASSAELLCPIEPGKILAVGLNYKSHIGNRTPPANPEIFYKPVSCLQHPGANIVIPRDASNVHYEGELVLVIGKRARNVSREEAPGVIFGVACGNDVSERDWQSGPRKDLQWWRAKGADTFGPLGPCIARGLNYGDILLTTRLNGAVVQQQRTSDLLFDCPAIVSFVSRYVSLEPGDVIYTGTPGATKKMSPGDTVEVEIEGIGALRNKVSDR